jgi:hypothetical protein
MVVRIKFRKALGMTWSEYLDARVSRRLDCLYQLIVCRLKGERECRIKNAPSNLHANVDFQDIFFLQN